MKQIILFMMVLLLGLSAPFFARAQEGLLNNPGRDNALLNPPKSAPLFGEAEDAQKSSAGKDLDLRLPGHEKKDFYPEMWGDGPDAKYMNDPLKHPIFQALPKDMQDSVLDETERYYRSCTRLSIYAAKHDCTCVSMKYFIMRLENPEMSQISIHDRVRLSCVDKPSIAGTYYERCLRIYSNLEPKTLNERCECYGRAMADIYSKNPNDNMYGQIDQGVLAMQRCRN